MQSFVLTTIGVGVGLGLAVLTLTRSLLLAAVMTAVRIAAAVLRDAQEARSADGSPSRRSSPRRIDLLGRAIRAGHPLSAGPRDGGRRVARAGAGEFRQCFEEQRFGLPFEDSLLGMADRVG